MLQSVRLLHSIHHTEGARAESSVESPEPWSLCCLTPALLCDWISDAPPSPSLPFLRNERVGWIVDEVPSTLSHSMIFLSQLPLKNLHSSSQWFIRSSESDSELASPERGNDHYGKLTSSLGPDAWRKGQWNPNTRIHGQLFLPADWFSLDVIEAEICFYVKDPSPAPTEHL